MLLGHQKPLPLPLGLLGGSKGRLPRLLLIRLPAQNLLPAIGLRPCQWPVLAHPVCPIAVM
jgi:hypothetical protein